LDLPEDDTVVDRELATSLFRILQETFTNIARHANATRVDVISGAPGAGTTIKIRVPETHHKD
jgi:signal transduction histidine kinase